jgi:hypothetical protein
VFAGLVFDDLGMIVSCRVLSGQTGSFWMRRCWPGIGASTGTRFAQAGRWLQVV